jgi:hypothetical protein
MHDETYLHYGRQVSSAYQQETNTMHTIFRRTLIALTLTTAAAVTPIAANAASFVNIFHLHPHPAITQAARYNFTISNHTYAYQEFKVNGVTYAVPSHFDLLVTAPAGTEIYAASKMGSYDRGSLLFTITPKDNDQKMVVR